MRSVSTMTKTAVGEGFDPPERKFTPRWGGFPSESLCRQFKNPPIEVGFLIGRVETLPYMDGTEMRIYRSFMVAALSRGEKGGIV